MRVAACFSGNMRSFRMCFPSFIKHIVEPSGHQFDIFVHTWTKLEHRRDPHLQASDQHVLDPREVVDMFHPVDMVVEESPVDHGSTSPTSMFKKVYQCDQLRQAWSLRTNVWHNVVIRLRPDLLFQEKFSWLGSEGSLFVPIGADHGGINDQMAWGPALAMEAYSNIGKDPRDGHPESMLKEHLRRVGQGNPERPPFQFRIVRIPEAELNGFFAPRSADPSPVSQLISAPIPQVTVHDPNDPDSPFVNLVRSLRTFWHPERYKGDMSGVTSLVNEFTKMPLRPGPVLCIDPGNRLQPSMSRHAPDSCAHAFPFKNDDLSISFSDGTFGTVVTATLLSHVTSRKARIRLLSEMGRVLKPDGELRGQLGIGPNPRFIRWDEEFVPNPDHLGHVELKSETDLRVDLLEAGLTMVSSEQTVAPSGDGCPNWLIFVARRSA